MSPEVHSSETDGDFSVTLNTEQAALYHSFIIVSAFTSARELKRNGRERKEGSLNSRSNTSSRVF